MLERLPTARVPVEWVASAKSDLSAFPDEVKAVLGHALFLAQIGGKHPDAKPLTGERAFRGAGVMAVADDYDGSTYRAVYTVRFSGIVYVLHAFQQKAKKGIATSRGDIALIKMRLKIAREHYEQTYGKREAG